MKSTQPWEQGDGPLMGHPVKKSYGYGPDPNPSEKTLSLSRPDDSFSTIMVLILDGNKDHDVHAWQKKRHIEK